MLKLFMLLKTRAMIFLCNNYCKFVAIAEAAYAEVA